MSIGTRIKEARRDKKLTQKQLADKVGIKQPTLSELENGDSAGTTMIASFASALGVNALWLETGKGEKFSTQQEPEKSSLNVDDHRKLAAYPAIIQEVIDLMMTADERGQLKVKIAAIDAIELHNSHLSRTRTVSLNDEEAELVESLRQASKMGKSVIKAAVNSAEKHAPTAKSKKAG